MAGVNKAIIIGALGRDPELRYTQGGQAVCKLSIATSRQWTDKQTGQRQEETEWHRVVVWGKQAENCNQYLAKGRRVYVEGRLKTSSYEKDGQTRYSTDIIAEEVQFLSSTSEGKGERPRNVDDPGAFTGSNHAYQPAPAEDDDIPF